MDITCILHVYHMYIPCISHGYHMYSYHMYVTCINCNVQLYSMSVVNDTNRYECTLDNSC